VDRTKVAQRDVTVTVLPAAPLRVGDAGARRSTRE
jgi:hypothetical protein